MVAEQDDGGLRDMLASMERKPDARGAAPTKLRQRIRDDFTAIEDARNRQVTWQQITAAMVAAGVKASDGSEPTWRSVMSFFHAERYSRGGKRERRKRPRPAVEAQPNAAPPPPAPSLPVEEEAPAPAAESIFQPLRRAAVPSAPAPSTPAPPPSQTNANDTIARLMNKRSSDRPAMPPIPKPQRDED